MQENEFEKQLKNLMDDLDLKPSDAVWEKVKRKLNNRNRKMVPFFFLLFAGLLIAGYFLYNHPVQNKIPQAVATDQNKNDNTIKTDSARSFDNTAQQKNKPAQAENEVAAKNDVLNNTQTYALHTHKKDGRLINANKNTEEKNDNIIPQKKQPLQAIDINPQPQSPAPFHNDKTNTIVANSAPVQQDNVVANDITANKQPSKNITEQSITENNNSNRNIDPQDSTNTTQNIAEALQTSHTKAKENIAVNNKITNWQWGITALYGKSNLVTGIIDFNKSITPSSLNNSSGIGNVSSNNKIYTSSEAYNIGGLVQKKIFKNGSVGIGLNYTHLSLKSGTAKQVDSALYVQYANGNRFTVSSYYNPGGTSNYKSTYNFIEVPVYFQQNIFTKNKIALSYNAGISVIQLLNSRSLVYDEYSNVYYANNNLLRKTQFQFSAGLKLNCKTSKNSSIFIGPQFSYSLSGLTKNTNSSNFHFITYGLQAGILLHKK